MKPKLVFSFFTITILIIVFAFTAKASVLLLDKFKGNKLDTSKWNVGGNAEWITAKDGMMVMNQKASGGTYVSVNSVESFPDCVIYYEWNFIERTGEGDCGGFLREKVPSPGGYIMRWWGTTNVRLSDNTDGPIAKWDDWPGCRSQYPTTSVHFNLRASMVKGVIKVHIWDEDTQNRFAEWEFKDKTYKEGKLYLRIISLYFSDTCGNFNA